MTAKLREVPELLITYDPGRVTGWAVFFNSRLVACGYGKFDKVIDLKMWPDCSGGVVQIEYPIAYPDGRSKADPNDMIRNAWRGGELANKCRNLGMRVEEVFPVRWKGTVPKPTSADEVYLIEERLLKKLYPEELKLLYGSKSARAKGLDHNMVDAVAAGLWRLKRRTPLCCYPST